MWSVDAAARITNSAFELETHKHFGLEERRLSDRFGGFASVENFLEIRHSEFRRVIRKRSALLGARTVCSGTKSDRES